jgi:hypothetical protein
MINTDIKFHLSMLLLLVAIIVGDSVATVASTGDVRCLFVKCVIVK